MFFQKARMLDSDPNQSSLWNLVASQRSLLVPATWLMVSVLETAPHPLPQFAVNFQVTTTQYRARGDGAIRSSSRRTLGYTKLISHLDQLENGLSVLQKNLANESMTTCSIISPMNCPDSGYDIHSKPQEQKIVECTTSCYVLGRSGTGKITTMLLKILSIQRAWQMSAIDMPKPHQIFVTKSRVLATKVEEYFMKLLKSLALAGYTWQELAKMKAQSVQEGLVDLDDLPKSHMNIPMKYSELEDKHFPLFATFDQLAKMITADILSKDVSETRDSAGLFFNVDDAEAHDCFITYEVFANQYWPHFPQNLTKTLNPWLVFSKFMRIVKGSKHVLTCPEGVIIRPNYLNLPHCSNTIFANQRGVLYDIFEIYTKTKRQRRHDDDDVADRTHAILKVLRSQKFPGKQIDYLYVDEAQDNLLINALSRAMLIQVIARRSQADVSTWILYRVQAFLTNTIRDLSAGGHTITYFLSGCHECVHLPLSSSVADQRSTTSLIHRQRNVSVLILHRGQILLTTETAHPLTDHGLFWAGDTAQTISAGSSFRFDDLKAFLYRVEQRQRRQNTSANSVGGEAFSCTMMQHARSYENTYIGLIMMLYESKGLEFNDICRTSNMMRRDMLEFVANSNFFMWESLEQGRTCGSSTSLRNQTQCVDHRRVIDCVQIVLLQQEQHSKSHRAPLPLFSTFDEELEFLEDFDLDYARASLLESHARYYEAAELHLSENRLWKPPGHSSRTTTTPILLYVRPTLYWNTSGANAPSESLQKLLLMSQCGTSPLLPIS
ncbi:hypothetical protein EDD22DRAFT_992573 [Suillus occidentalis]|nr:hypothetical protein EDD22DRAFT_992573 [Suillus occidentalis]